MKQTRALLLPLLVSLVLMAAVMFLTWVSTWGKGPTGQEKGLPAAFDERYALDVATRLAALGPRIPGSKPHAAARDLIAAELSGIAQVEVSREETRHGPMANLFATLPARTGDSDIEAVVHGRGLVMVGAHYDSVPGSPGAADDAGGVAIVLAMAKALGPEPRYVYPITFAFWDGEEDELAGSAADADRREREGRLPVAVIAFDLVGWRDGPTVIHTFRDALWAARPMASADLVRPAFMSGVGLPIGDPVISPVYQVLTRLGRVPFDADDGAYGRYGVPALFISDSSFTRFDPHYHSPRDTADTLSAENLGRAGRLALKLVHHGARVEADSGAWVAVGNLFAGPGALVALLVLAVCPAAWFVWRARGRTRVGAVLVVFVVAALMEPAAALLWLAPGLLVAPAAIAGRGVLRVLACIVALAMPVACFAVYGVAVARFGFLPPRVGIPALAAHLVAIAVLTICVLARPRGAAVVAGKPSVAG